MDDNEVVEAVHRVIEKVRKVEDLLKGTPYEVVATFLTNQHVALLEFAFLSESAASIEGPLEAVTTPCFEGARRSSKMLMRMAEVTRPAEFREAFPNFRAASNEDAEMVQFIRTIFGL